MAEITVERVRKTFGPSTAVDEVSLTVSEGELLVLLGPSGCGKTTLLRMIAGFEEPDSGTIRIGGRDVTGLPPRERGIAMVFQSYALFPHMHVRENIGFGLRMHRIDAAEQKRRIERAAELLEIGTLLERFPSELSGGQRQRVAVGRALVMEPAVLLMDEPLSNLDALLRLQFRAELKRLLDEVNATTVYVTHDQVEALSLGTRTAVMRAGRVVQCDDPLEVYDHPATTFVAGFIGSPPMNVLRGIVGHEDGRAVVTIGGHEIPLDDPRARDARDGDEAIVGIRAESIELLAAQEPGAIPAELVVAEALGSHAMLTLRVDGQSLKAVTRPEFQGRAGEKVWIRPEDGKLRWLARDADPGAPASKEAS